MAGGKPRPCVSSRLLQEGAAGNEPVSGREFDKSIAVSPLPWCDGQGVHKQGERVKMSRQSQPDPNLASLIASSRCW